MTLPSQVVRGTKSRQVDPGNLLTERAGCGGCWGAGQASAQRKLEEIMGRVQAEVERSDFCMGFLLVSCTSTIIAEQVFKSLAGFSTA